MLPKTNINHPYSIRKYPTRKYTAHHPFSYKKLHNPRKPVSLIRMAWVRYNNEKNEQSATDQLATKSENLIQRFSEEGLDIWVLNRNRLSTLQDIACFDFVFIEGQCRSDRCMAEILQQLQVEQCPSSPIVILTDQPCTHHSVDLIQAGADELFSHATPDEVILARCRALLRRFYCVI